MCIAFADDSAADSNVDKLITIKNRLCCPSDKSPLFTILDKNLESYQYKVRCKACGTRYTGEMIR